MYAIYQIKNGMKRIFFMLMNISVITKQYNHTSPYYMLLHLQKFSVPCSYGPIIKLLLRLGLTIKWSNILSLTIVLECTPVHLKCFSISGNTQKKIIYFEIIWDFFGNDNLEKDKIITNLRHYYNYIKVTWWGSIVRSIDGNALSIRTGRRY